MESGPIAEDTPCGIMEQLVLECAVEDYSRAPESQKGRSNQPGAAMRC